MTSVVQQSMQVLRVWDSAFLEKSHGYHTSCEAFVEAGDRLSQQLYRLERMSRHKSQHSCCPSSPNITCQIYNLRCSRAHPLIISFSIRVTPPTRSISRIHLCISISPGFMICQRHVAQLTSPSCAYTISVNPKLARNRTRAPLHFKRKARWWFKAKPFSL